MLLAGLVYGGFSLFLVGCASLVRPLVWLGIGNRGGSMLVLISGLLLMMLGLAWPATEKGSASSDSQLNQFIPVYQFHEFHSLRMNGNADQVYRAIKGVTADEISLFRSLTWIRRCGRALPAGILNAPKGQPILELAIRTSFQLLAEEPGREIVLGTLVIAPPGSQRSTIDFKTQRAPGYALAAINFRVNDSGHGQSLVSTETRVYATDAQSRRKVARYWRVIYPGSALIRRMWLRAIKHRAEKPIA